MQSRFRTLQLHLTLEVEKGTPRRPFQCDQEVLNTVQDILKQLSPPPPNLFCTAFERHNKHCSPYLAILVSVVFG